MSLRFAEAVVRLTEALTWRANAKAKAPLERALEREVAAIFRAQGKAFEQELAKRMREAAFPAWEEAWAAVAARYGKRFVDAIAKATEKAVRIAFRRTIADQTPTGEQMAITFGDGNGQRTKVVREYLQAHAADRVTRINDTTRDEMRRLINQGINEGVSTTEITKRIQGRFTEFAIGKPQQHIQSRAHLVAVTEIGDAYTEGTLQASQELARVGLPQEKSWLNSGDNKVSAGCLANTAEGWIDLDAAFPSGHQRPLRFPGCRCDLLTRRKK